MNSVTVPVPESLRCHSSLLLVSQRGLVDLKQAHVKAGLNCRDLRYLEAPMVASRKGLTFRGVSIE